MFGYSFVTQSLLSTKESLMKAVLAIALDNLIAVGALTIDQVP